MTITLIRHGQSQSNANPLIAVSDSPLTPQGREEVHAAAGSLRAQTFHVLYSSNQLRARETAAILQHHLNLPHVIRPELHEKRNRPFPRHEVDPHQSEAAFLAMLDALPDHERWHYRAAPDTETEHEALTRFFRALATIAADHPDQHALVVSHGNLMRTLLVHCGYTTFQEARVGTMCNTGQIVLRWQNEPQLLTVTGFTPYSMLQQ